MDPKLCRDINLMTMDLIANYFEQPISKVQALYQELLDDHQFMAEINQLRLI